MDQLAQLAVNGVVSGSAYALAGMALVLIVGVTGRFHFALSTSYVLGAYTFVAVAERVHLLIGAACCVAVAAAAGVVAERVVYRPIAERSPNEALVSVFVAAFGIVLVTENLIRLVYRSGASVRGISGFRDTSHHVAGLVFTHVDLFQVGSAAVIAAGLTWLLYRTRWGRQVQAVRVNPELSRLFDLSPNRVFVSVFALGSAICGLATISQTLRNAATPDMGINPVFYGFVVAFLAGFGSAPWRAAAVGLGIGVAASVATRWLSPALSSVVVFSVLFIVLARRSLATRRASTRTRRLAIRTV